MSQKLTNLDALTLAGHSVVRPVDRTNGVAVKKMDEYIRRPAAERVHILKDTVITLQDKDAAGKKLRKPKTLSVRTVAVFSSSANKPGKADQRVGLVECRATGEVFFLWSHFTKRDGTFCPAIYDLGPELLVEEFEKFDAMKAENADMPAELRALNGAA